MQKSLNGSEIQLLIQKDNVACIPFLGVFSIDKLPNLSFFPASAIINTHPSKFPGEHWLAFYISQDKKCTFFDTYGRSPSYFGLHDYFAKFSNSVQYNCYQYQSFNTASCGYYAIFFIRLVSRGWNLKQITQCLSKKNFILNDIFIESLINNI